MKLNSKFKFVLYVATGTQNSVTALNNLRALCRMHLPGRHEIEIVDVFKEPIRALADRIFMTPTLIKLAPLPLRRIVGTLSEPGKVLQALDLESVAA